VQVPNQCPTPTVSTPIELSKSPIEVLNSPDIQPTLNNADSTPPEPTPDENLSRAEDLPNVTESEPPIDTALFRVVSVRDPIVWILLSSHEVSARQDAMTYLVG